MHRIHRTHPETFQGFCQSLSLISDLQALLGQGQNSHGLVATLLVWNTPHFILERFGIQQDHVSGLNCGQDRQDGLCFNLDPWLCLVIQRTLEAAAVKGMSVKDIIREIKAQRKAGA